MVALHIIVLTTLLSTSGLALVALKPIDSDFIALRNVHIGARQAASCTPPVMPPGVAETDCPHTYNLDASGNCTAGLPSAQNVNSDGSNCLSYCEQSITFGYGTEIPFENAYCEAESACALQTGNSTTNTNAFSFNVGYSLQVGEDDAKEAFTIGASYQWSQSVTYTTTVVNNKPSNDTRGGYFTFVPWTITSCGTLTQTQLQKEIPAGCPRGQCLGPLGCDPGTAKSVSNWCNTTPVTVNGEQLGYVIFVFQPIDGDRVPYIDNQNSIYYTPGVSNNPTFQAQLNWADAAGLAGWLEYPTA